MIVVRQLNLFPLKKVIIYVYPVRTKRTKKQWTKRTMIRKTNAGYFWFDDRKKNSRKNWFLAQHKVNKALIFPKELLGKRVMVQIIEVDEFEEKIKRETENLREQFGIKHLFYGQVKRDVEGFEVTYPNGLKEFIDLRY